MGFMGRETNRRYADGPILWAEVSNDEHSSEEPHKREQSSNRKKGDADAHDLGAS